MNLIGGLFLLLGGLLMILWVPKRSQEETSVATFLFPGFVTAAGGAFFLYQAVSELNR